MKRLFRRWDTDMNNTLSLQNVVTGFAQVKGTKDIMSNISYFFELYDDDGDGRVDREGILRISEALLFLSRRGFQGTLSPSSSMHDLAGSPERRENRDEQFLSSISAFIRRCFEYADPDHAAKQTAQAAADFDNFSIGSAGSEDLVDLSDPSSPKPTPASHSPSHSRHTKHPLSPTLSTTNPLSPIKEKAAHANLALDPNNPLHITLPTFRMVILADEVLESFFESGFSASFRLTDSPLPSHASSSNLTTFANAGRGGPAGTLGASVGGAGVGVVPPGKGIRGMLDNIVSDGMRVAAEVRRRMDEAQRELEQEGRQDREEEEEDGRDGELLEGAETADVEVGRRVAGDLLDVPSVGKVEDGKVEGRKRSASEASRKVVEFER
jgi:hypothetical protein